MPCSHLDKMDDHLYVLTMVSNPSRFSRRIQLFNDFCDRMTANEQVKLIAVELATGDRPFVTSAQVKLRSRHILWHKENCLNIAATHLPPTAKYVAWIDSDLVFDREDWVSETIHALQIYDVVWPWSHCIDMGPENEAMQIHKSFGRQYHLHGRYIDTPTYGGADFFHPGYAVAFRIEAWNAIGGLFEHDILGSGDHTMSLALVGEAVKHLRQGLPKNYEMLVADYQERCKALNKNIGHVKGTIRHHFHGKKVNRQYMTRWSILTHSQYDPIHDIFKDNQGLWQLTHKKPGLRDNIRKYFERRNEDCDCLY